MPGGGSFAPTRRRRPAAIAAGSRRHARCRGETSAGSPLIAVRLSLFRRLPSQSLKFLPISLGNVLHRSGDPSEPCRGVLGIARPPLQLGDFAFKQCHAVFKCRRFHDHTSFTAGKGTPWYLTPPRRRLP